MFIKNLSIVQNMEEKQKEKERQKREEYEAEVKKREEKNQASRSNSAHSASISDDDVSTVVGDGSISKGKEIVEGQTQQQQKHFLPYGKTGDPEKDAKRAAKYETRRAKRLEQDEKRGYKKVPGDISWPVWGGL